MNRNSRFDPQPVKYKNEDGKCERIKNLCLNYASLTGQSVTLLQIGPLANSYALSHDHDYFENTAENHFLLCYNIARPNKHNRTRNCCN